MKWIEKTKIFLDTHPKLRNTTISMAAIFGAGFGVGVYVTVLLQKQLAALGASGYIIAIFSGLTTVIVIFNQLQEWRKKKNAPTLSFHEIKMSQYLKDEAYSIKLVLSQSGEEAKRCHSYITVDDYSSTIVTRWLDNNLQHMNIGETGQLGLFTIVQNESGKSIFLATPPSSRAITLSYGAFIDKKLTIKIVCENAKLDSPYVKKISEIIEEGRKNTE